MSSGGDKESQVIREAIERAILQASLLPDLPTLASLQTSASIFSDQVRGYVRNQPVVIMLGIAFVMFLMARILTQGRR
jgi:hypothetical protein